MLSGLQMTSGVILLALLVLLLGFLYGLINAIRLGPLNRRPWRSRLLRRLCLSNESRGLRPRCGSWQASSSWAAADDGTPHTIAPWPLTVS